MPQLVHTVSVAAPALLRGAAAQSHRCHRAPPPVRLDRPLRRCASVLAYSPILSCSPVQMTSWQPCLCQRLNVLPYHNIRWHNFCDVEPLHLQCAA